MADRSGADLRRPLRSAERFSERALFLGGSLKTPFCRSSASLVSIIALPSGEGSRAFQIGPGRRCPGQKERVGRSVLRIPEYVAIPAGDAQPFAMRWAVLASILVCAC